MHLYLVKLKLILNKENNITMRKTRTIFVAMISLFTLCLLMVFCLSLNMSTNVEAKEDTECFVLMADEVEHTETAEVAPPVEETEQPQPVEQQPATTEDAEDVSDTINAIVEQLKDVDVESLKENAKGVLYAIFAYLGVNGIAILGLLIKLIFGRKSSEKLALFMDKVAIDNAEICALLEEVQKQNEELKAELIKQRKKDALDNVAEADKINNSITEALATIEEPTLD